MQISMIDFVDTDAKAGFRLDTLELLNWGTFGQFAWKLEPKGNNTLLTGDIGSGKSTIVDAITTLLVPHHRIIYNRAAGAESKERNLYSYIRGEFKNTKDQDSFSAKSVYLRDEKSFTVLLSVFYNEGFDQYVTLAQVFWLKHQDKNPERFFLVVEGLLTITKHFSNFGPDISLLKKQLKKTPKCEIFDSFKEYAQRFRQLFCIQSEQALDLFYQTVSMKSVGNLTDFVRQQMLEKTNVLENIESLKQNFENLNRAHEAVIKVKKQIEFLTPLVDELRSHDKYAVQVQNDRETRELLDVHFAKQKITLLDAKLETLTLEQEKAKQSLERCRQALIELQGNAAQLKNDIDDHGGKRLQVIAQELQQLEQTKSKVFNAAERYRNLCQLLAIACPENENIFIETKHRIQQLQEECNQVLQRLQEQQIQLRIKMQACDQNIRALDEELASLKQRKNNIPAKMLAIREVMVAELKLNVARLPFVGELLKVAEEECAWEGAAERVLHNFGLSLLVPDEYYELVSRYVDKTALRGKLVYYRVRSSEKQIALKQDKNLLTNKILIKPESEFFFWLQQECQMRFDYLCCEALNDFRRASKALTQQGQIKSPGERHEKDDRYDLFDRSRYILGWTNQEKILVLEKQKAALQKEGDAYLKALSELDQKNKQTQKNRDACRDLLHLQDYAEIDWQTIAKQIQALLEEKSEIEKTSNILKTLQAKLQQTQQKIVDQEAQRDQLNTNLGKLEAQITQLQSEKTSAEALFSSVSSEQYKNYFSALEKYQQEALAENRLHLNNFESLKRQVREYIQKEIDNLDKKCARLRDNIIAKMQVYKKDYPAETSEIDASLLAGKEYQQILKNLTSEDLPRHESRFKALLNEGTINGVALLQNQLNAEKQAIEDKIKKINISLHDIEYNAQLHTYIKLAMDPSEDADIRQFQQDLRACLSHTASSENFYDEEKFLQVKALIARFQGRTDQAEADKRWMIKVTDVRNWFSFSASECFLEDNVQHEFYTDSSGKSGGQKEKLAYTILASALVYQFGLEWNTKKSRSFRFVVIDEAFGRGSDESTRYGMELFKKLNLQLMIVTPLQKINIIENYVNSVHYVHNYEGQRSVVRGLSIQAYQENKAKFLESAP